MDLSAHAEAVLHGVLLAVAIALFVTTAWLVARHRRRTVPRGEVLGIELLLGLLGSAAALVVFVDVATGIVRPGRMAAIDVRVHDALYRAATPSSVWFWRVVTWLGAPPLLAAVVVLIALWLGWRRQWLYFTGWIAAFVGEVLLDQELKHLFHRARPLQRYTAAHGWSFPSGHSMGSAVFYGMLAYLLARNVRNPQARGAAVVAALVLVLVVGMSRVFLGVHWFFDVIGGWCAGAVWLGACIGAMEVARHRSTRPARGTQDLRDPV